MEQKSRVYSLFIEEAYAIFLHNRYGVTTHTHERDYSNLKDIHDFYMPDVPFEKMTKYTMNQQVNASLFIEKYNIL